MSASTWRRATSAVAGTLALLAPALLPAPAQALCAVSVLSPCIELSMPTSPLSLGALTPGTTTTSAEQTLTVSSNLGYGIKVSSDLVDGRMKEWTGAAYAGGTPKILAAPLRVAQTSYNGTPATPVWQPLSSTPSVLVTGLGATGCLVGLLCSSRTVGVSYRQPASFADRRAAPNAYRVLVTYTADHAF